MRLIDADALIKEHCDGCEYYDSHFCAPDDPVCGAVEVMNDAPTIDAVEVVRCKDCKYWDCYGGEDAHKGDCAELVGLDSCMYENDFCSYGERRSE